MANKNYKDDKEYTEEKEGGKRREYKKKYHHKRSKKEGAMTKEEIKDDVDSDGFEVVGSKEDKKQKYRDEHRGEFISKRGRGRGNWKRGAQWKRKDHDNEKKEKMKIIKKEYHKCLNWMKIIKIKFLCLKNIKNLI